MKLSEIFEMIRNNVSDPTGARFNNTRLLQYYKLVSDSFCSYSLILEKYVQISTTPGTYNYQVQLLVNHGIEWVTCDGIPLYMMIQKQNGIVNWGEDFLTKQSRPENWNDFTMKGYITLLPVPDSVYSIDVWYRGKENIPTTYDSNWIPEIPEEWHEGLIAGITSICFMTLKEWLDAKQMRSIYNEMKIDAIKRRRALGRPSRLGGDLPIE